MNTVANRIKEAMSLRNMKQADLVEKTGIGKSSISQYISGEYKPKNKNLYLIAKVLKVNKDWLEGEDVPMDKLDGYALAEFFDKKFNTEKLSKEITDLYIFQSYIESLGYKMKIESEEPFMYTIFNNDMKANYNEDEFQNFRSSINKLIEFEIFKQAKLN